MGLETEHLRRKKSVLGDQSKELRAQDDNPKVTFIFGFVSKLTFSKRFWRKWEHILRLINTKVTSWLISFCILRPDGQKWQSRWSLHSYELDNKTPVNKKVRSSKPIWSDKVVPSFSPFSIMACLKFSSLLLFLFVCLSWPWDMADLSSLTGDWFCASAVQAWSLNPRTAREVLSFYSDYLHIIWLNSISLSKLKHDWPHPIGKLFQSNCNSGQIGWTYFLKIPGTCPQPLKPTFHFC